MTMEHKTPRLLVADDDVGVIAAYRLVLETMPDPATANNLFGLSALESELFGATETPAEVPNWRVKFVDQGMDAVREVQWAIDDGDPFTAIFLDVRMPPGIDGYETATRIRAIDPEVHIVVVTAFSDYTYEEFVQTAGPAEHLTLMPKPVWPEELRKVARLLTSRQTVEIPKAVTG